MELSKQQKIDYSGLRAAGFTQDEALASVTGTKKESTEGRDGILFGEKSLTSAIGGGIREATLGTFEEIQSDIETYGALPTIAKSPLAFFAGAGRGVGEVAGGVFETIDDITGERISRAIQPSVQRFAESEGVQTAFQKAQALDKATYGVAGDLFDILDLVGATAAVKAAPVKQIKSSILTAAKKTKDVADIGVDVTKAKFRDIFKKPEVFKQDTMKEALASPKTGLTSENIGSVRKQITGEQALLPVADKEALLKVDPDMGKDYLDVLRKSEESYDNPSIFERAITDTQDVFKQYDTATKGVGSEVGAIKIVLESKTPSVANVKKIREEFVDGLAKKGVVLSDEGKFIKEGASPFSSADRKVLDDVLEDLVNVESTSDMKQLLLTIEALDNKIVFSKSADVTGSVQGIAKNVRAKLKKERDTHLTTKEQGVFDEFSKAITFVNEFKKGNIQNKIGVLLNRAGSKRDYGLKNVAKEIKRVTGVDIEEFAHLSRILAEATSGTGRNRSVLRQHFGDAAGSILRASPLGAAETVVTGVAKGFLDVNKIAEIEKAISTTVKGLTTKLKPKAKKPTPVKTKSTDQTSSPNDTPNSTPSKATLVEQAKGYKTADEFIKAKQKDVVYHGSSEPLEKFDDSGAFFTDDMMNAEGYAGGENVFEGFLDLKKPLIIDAKGRHYADLKTPYGKSTQEIVGKVDSKKYDGVIFKNINDSFADDVDAVGTDTIFYPFNANKAFINESQLKDIWDKANKK